MTTPEETITITDRGTLVIEHFPLAIAIDRGCACHGEAPIEEHQCDAVASVSVVIHHSLLRDMAEDMVDRPRMKGATVSTPISRTEAQHMVRVLLEFLDGEAN